MPRPDPSRAHPPGGRPESPLRRYLREIESIPTLTHEQQHALMLRIVEGDSSARDDLVRCNLRLVVEIARGYVGKGLTLEDLIEEGNLGLLRAVEGYDETSKTQFHVYPSYWIKQALRRAIMDVPRPPMRCCCGGAMSLLAKWRRASAVLAGRLGRPPTDDEVGKALRLTKKKRRIIAEAIRERSLAARTEEDVEGDLLPGDG